MSHTRLTNDASNLKETCVGSSLFEYQQLKLASKPSHSISILQGLFPLVYDCSTPPEYRNKHMNSTASRS